MIVFGVADFTPSKGFGALADLGGNADTLLDFGAAVALAPPKGVGAFADMGGNAAALIAFFATVSFAPPKGAAALANQVAVFAVPKGVGAFADMGGNADVLLDSETVFIFSLFSFSAADDVEVKLNGVTLIFPDPSLSFDDAPVKPPKLNPSDDAFPTLLLDADTKLKEVPKGVMGFAAFCLSTSSFSALPLVLNGVGALDESGGKAEVPVSAVRAVKAVPLLSLGIVVFVPCVGACGFATTDACCSPSCPSTSPQSSILTFVSKVGAPALFNFVSVRI